VLAGRWPRLGLAPAALIAIGGYVVSSYLPFVYGWGGTSSLFVAPLIAAGALADVHGERSPFRVRTMVWLGEISFAFYMLHRIVIMQVHRLFAATGGTFPPVAAAGLILAALALSVFLSWLLYTYVENPLVRRFSRPRVRPEPEVGLKPHAPA